MARRVYEVVSVHKNHDPVNGTFRLEVVDAIGDEPAVYVTGQPFGCSRNYAGVSDGGAIYKLLAEHGAEVSSCIQVPSLRALWRAVVTWDDDSEETIAECMDTRADAVIAARNWFGINELEVEPFRVEAV